MPLGGGGFLIQFYIPSLLEKSRKPRKTRKPKKLRKPRTLITGGGY